MQKSLHIKFLEFLEPNGLGQWVDISKFMKANFVAPYSDDYSSGDEEDLGLQFILNLGKRGHIYYDPNDIKAINKIDENDKRIWFDDFNVNVAIDIDGLEYLNKYRLNQTLLDANKASLRNFWSTGILAFLTVVLTGLTFKETKNNTAELAKIEQRIDTLSLQLLRVQLGQKLVKNPVAFDAELSHKPQPSSLNK